MILPRPPHAEQACVLTICPSRPWGTARTAGAAADPPPPAARRASLRADHLPEQALAHGPHRPGPAARIARVRLGPADAVADLAVLYDLNVHFTVDPVGGLA